MSLANNPLFNSQPGQWTGVRWIGTDAPLDSFTEDPLLSASILAALQACERLLSSSEKGDHAVKTKLDECLAQLHALKLVLALHGIVDKGDLEDDPLFVDILGRAQAARRLQEAEAKNEVDKAAADAKDGWTKIIAPDWGHPDGLVDERGDLLRAFSLSVEDLSKIWDVLPGAIIRVKP